MNTNPKVFISYSHQDADYEDKVLSFANKLRKEGIDANIDLYEESPPEGWPRWMENQIRNADFVLVVCDKSYYEKCYSDHKGKGVSWEVNIVYQHIYDASTENTKFIPIFFDYDDMQYILTPLKAFTYYNVGDDNEYEKLYWRLRGVSRAQKPSLGKLKPLPEKERKTMFFTSPIDLDKWDTARWTGMLYLFSPGHCPVLGILYKNYDAAKTIFQEWKQLYPTELTEDFIGVDFIIPPFPKDCWVYSDQNRNYGQGYFVHIGPNIDKAFQRGLDSGIEPSDLMLTTVSRYQWMDENNGSQNRELFMQYMEKGFPYMLLPVGIKDIHEPISMENLIIDLELSLTMKTATFKRGIDIKDDDLCKIVLTPPIDEE